VDFDGAYVANGFEIKLNDSGKTVVTTALPGSNGEPPAWKVQLTKRSGKLTAISDDDVPKIECERQETKNGRSDIPILRPAPLTIPRRSVCLSLALAGRR
jgi:hypothetical protein